GHHRVRGPRRPLASACWQPKPRTMSPVHQISRYRPGTFERDRPQFLTGLEGTQGAGVDFPGAVQAGGDGRTIALLLGYGDHRRTHDWLLVNQLPGTMPGNGKLNDSPRYTRFTSGSCASLSGVPARKILPALMM